MLKIVALFAVMAVALAGDKLMENPKLFEGDIAGGIEFDASRGLAQLPTVLYEKWPSGIVYYETNGYTESENNVIQAAMKAIEDQTRVNGKNCITFTPRTNQANYLYISRTGSGCYSSIGKKRLPGSQQVSLDTGCLHNMIAAHELMHALGILHEQSRPDRDDYVIINLAPVPSDMHHNFAKYTTGVDVLDTPYDILSIMHYQNDAFSTTGEFTVTAKDGTVLVNASKKSRLTDYDAYGIKKHYGC